MNLRWKGRQPKSPNGSDQKLYSQVKTHFLGLEFINSKLLKLYSILFMLESLVNLVTPIRECADMLVLNLVFLSVFYDC